MPWWVQAIAIVGLPGILALILLGDRLNLLPGVKSPTQQAREDLNRMEQTLREHGSILRWTCHSMWVHGGAENEKLAKVCWQRFNGDPGRSDRDAGD